MAALSGGTGRPGDRPPIVPDGELDGLVYESDRTRVLRIAPNPAADPAGQVAHHAGAGAIWKEPVGPDDADRFRHEVAVLTRLAGVEGVVPLAAPPGRTGGFALADVGGVSLAGWLQRTDLPEGCLRVPRTGRDVPPLVRFALDLARVLARVHAAGVVHNDVNPANILVAGADQRPFLIDWDVATTFAEERRGFTHESAVVGTLPYLAPEQTGRTGHGVDTRADLYALGATLYEVATGSPPFGHGDALTLISAHLARVPEPPAARNPAIPRLLSDVVLRLLEKEPDGRYQSAAGLAHDLDRLLAILGAPGDPGDPAAGAGLTLGERDFPTRLRAPSRLIGRGEEVRALRAALAGARTGEARVVLVSGGPGVGKTGLIDELRPAVTEHGGWFVQGKFDQFRQDESTDGVAQALRALAGILLAEPEDRLRALRARLLANLGPEAEVLAAMHPEFGSLLDVMPAPLVAGDVQRQGARLLRLGVSLLRTVASPERPVVLVVDDLQWAGTFPIAFLDAVALASDLPGLLLVGAYRDAEVDSSHPLTGTLSRWERLGVAATRLRLTGLPAEPLGTFVAEMLRLPAGADDELAVQIRRCTGGNPYDTVELVNGLRRDGVLVSDSRGWQWDPDAVRRYVTDGDVLGLLADRINALPAATRPVLTALACLGGEVALDLLARAEDTTPEAVSARLAPALEDGLLVHVGDGSPAVRFRHDRVQQAAYALAGPAERGALQLRIARRLAGHPPLESLAAEQYLAVLASVTDAGERRRAAVLLRAAALHGRLINPARAEEFLRGAIDLLARSAPAGAGDGTDDGTDDQVTQLLLERHEALLHLARLVEADALFEEIERRVPGSVRHARASAVQMISVYHRGSPDRAVALAVARLAELGFPAPAAAELAQQLDDGLERLYRWAARAASAPEPGRADPDDERVLAASALLARAVPAAFYCRHPMFGWLVFTAHRLWVEHGPNGPLATCFGGTSLLGILHRDDYALGYRVCRRVLEVSAARGYEPETSQLRNTTLAFASHWFEPLEDVVHQARSVRESLLRCGETQFASFTYVATLWTLLDCAPALGLLEAEISAAMTFFARTGFDSKIRSFRCYEQLLACLRGTTHAPGGFDDDSFTEADWLAGIGADPVTRFNHRCVRGLAAAVFDDGPELGRQAAAAMSFLPHVAGMYLTTTAWLLRGLALAREGRDRHEAERCAAWLAARAQDAPENFEHLACWLQAELASAWGGEPDALRAFDAALSAARQARRPWHEALIAERAGRFHHRLGLATTGDLLLQRARGAYLRWGAHGKVAHLDAEFRALLPAATSRVDPTWQPGTVGGTGTVGHPTTSAGRSGPGVAGDVVELPAILRAARALGSQPNLDRLRATVVEVLGEMTGATAVRLLLWNDEAQEWFLPHDDPAQPAIRVEDAGRAGLLCLSAFRYAQRTGEPLLVPQATRDERFRRDPSLAGLDSCSLMVVPISARGRLRAMLVLENRLSDGVFTVGRLDAVLLLAGQLTVCLETALAERFRSLVQRSSELTLVCDRRGVLSYASPASQAMLGVADRLLVGRLVTEFVHPDDVAAVGAWLARPGAGATVLGCRVRGVDGAVREVEAGCTDLSLDPAVAGIVLHLRDVTERRRLEAQLRHAQRMESVGQLASGLAHEINSPVQFIGDNLRFIDENLATLDDLVSTYREALAGADPADPAGLAARRRAVAVQERDADLEYLREELPLAARQALDGAHRVARIVQAMKAFSQQGEEKSFTDLNEAVRTTLVVANNEIQAVADVVEDLGDLPPAWCAVGDLNQVILNLVVNAAQAMAETVSTAGRGTLTVRTRREGDNLRIDVQDTGPGIPPAIADRVFDQFFTTKPVGTGTGQGLALAYTLVHDRHGGTIGFTSRPGTGTTFTVRLPHRPAPPAAEPGAAARP